MKKLIYALVFLVAFSTSFMSCSTDSNSVELTSICYISSFKLVTVKRTVHTTSSKGVDSTYSTTVNASALRMLIDHRAGIITNVDLLPNGSRLDKVPVTIAAEGSIVYAHASDTSSWTAYNSKDSLDFTHPLILRVLATNGKSYRDYTVTISARDNEAYNYTWQRLPDISDMKDKTSAHLVYYVTSGIDGGEYPFLFTSDAGGRFYYAEPSYASSNERLPSVWAFNACEGLDSDCDVTTIVSFKNRLWMSSGSGKVFVGEEPRVWHEVQQQQAVRLVAASSTALYGAILGEEGYTMASSVDGSTWLPTTIDGAGFNAPLTGIAYTQTNGNRRVLVLADAYTGTEDVPLFVWNLLEGSDEPWLPFNDVATKNSLPRWQHPELLHYNKWLLALGSGDKSGQHKNLADIYISHDNGLNWKTDSYLSTPSALRGAEGSIAAMVFQEYVWIIAGTQQWVMRYNSYGENL